MGGARSPWRWSEAIPGRHSVELLASEPVKVGVLRGEGSGPEVIAAALEVLSAVAEVYELELFVTEGPAPSSASAHGGLSNATADFCRDTFAAGGAVLAGPHAGRWVYDVRRRFDLFCKISPLRPSAELDLPDATISPASLAGVDVLVVREQSAGIYQGRWAESVGRGAGRVAEHSFSYTEREARRIVATAATLARWRRGQLAMIVKDGGIPSISRLWRDCAEEVVGEEVSLEVLDVDYAVYRILREPGELDVVVAPNLFGDLLADAGGVLLGSRGITFGGNFDGGQAAIYQTNHGAAHDLAGRDRANPAGQILAAAMMLRESFGHTNAADLVEFALADAWREGWRTEDVADRRSRVVGTRRMAEQVAAAAQQLGAEAVAASPHAR